MDFQEILWIGSSDAPDVLSQAADGLWAVKSLSRENLRSSLTGGVVAAVVDGQACGADEILKILSEAGVAAIILGDGLAGEPGLALAGVLHLGDNVSAEELRIRLDSVAALRPAMARSVEELAAARSLARYAARTADELDEEMKLASRLQQDFLPRQLPKVGSVRFGVFFQPAGFVSGDIYETTRLDETHVGFYVADAVGHGLPAALLTMFIKEALQTKRITGNSYEIVPPHEALAQLNADLCRQQLSMCEFCTGIYGIIDTESLVVTMSRAGHPPAILLNEAGARELEQPGQLLGIMEEATFESRSFQLSPGDRLILYSDGFEECFPKCDGHGCDQIIEVIKPLAELPRDLFIQRVSELVNNANATDDVTVLLTEV
ncbi:MAG: hypothetical protein DRP83_09445 [Planctomycetota bacterium]|nr:MAG: hypothetical protein DRP83_09445 [Planctomycetota bacterium]